MDGDAEHGSGGVPSVVRTPTREPRKSRIVEPALHTRSDHVAGLMQVRPRNRASAPSQGAERSMWETHPALDLDAEDHSRLVPRAAHRSVGAPPWPAHVRTETSRRRKLRRGRFRRRSLPIGSKRERASTTEEVMAKSILSSLSVAALAGGSMLALELSPASAFTLSGAPVQLVTSGQFDKVYYRGYHGGYRGTWRLSPRICISRWLRLSWRLRLSRRLRLPRWLWLPPLLWIRRRGGHRRGGDRCSCRRRSGRTPLLDQ